MVSNRAANVPGVSHITSWKMSSSGEKRQDSITTYSETGKVWIMKLETFHICTDCGFTISCCKFSNAQMMDLPIVSWEFFIIWLLVKQTHLAGDQTISQYLNSVVFFKDQVQEKRNEITLLSFITADTHKNYLLSEITSDNNRNCKQHIENWNSIFLCTSSRSIMQE